MGLSLKERRKNVDINVNVCYINGNDNDYYLKLGNYRRSEVEIKRWQQEHKKLDRR